MAAAFGAAATGQSKTAGTTVTSGSLTVAAGDLLLIGFVCDDTAGTFTPSDSGGNTWTLSEGPITRTGEVSAFLWYAYAAAGGSFTATVTHPSLTARAISFANFTGAGSFARAGGGIAAGIGNMTYYSSASLSATDEIIIGMGGSEGPNGDTFVGSSSGTPALANTIVGKDGTTGQGASSNVTGALAYVLNTASNAGYQGQMSNTTAARGEAGAGAVFSAAATNVLRRPIFVQQAVNRASSY